MNFSSAADLRHGQAEGLCPRFEVGDDALLVHNANDISIIATLQQQSCKVPGFSSDANWFGMDGFSADTEFVKDLCRWADLAPSALAKKAGLTPTTLLRPFNGTATTRLSQPTFDKLRAKFPQYPGWNRDMTDHVGMLGDRPDPNERPAELVYVREVDIRFAMGEGAEVEDYPAAGLVPFNLGFIQSITKTPTEDLVIFGGQGDSMEPTLLRSDVLMFDKGNRAPLMSDDIWAFHYAGGGYIKRLRFIREDGRNKYEIISDNKGVPPRVAEIEDVHIVGKLVWVGRRM